MTRQTRRGALAAGASTLAALAGCSSLPFTGGGGGDDLPAYDEVTLADAIRNDTPDAPETYPGDVPESLLESHRDRTMDLLASVPEDPSFPNEAMADQLRQKRERAVERRPEATPTTPTLADVADWRRARQRAAAVAFAHRAATGDLDAGDVESRRRRVRDDSRAEWSELTYVGTNQVEALAVSFELESVLADARRALSPDGSFPTDPLTEPFQAGTAAASVEEARAHLDTAVGLRDAHEEPEMADYWSELAAAAGRLTAARRATTERVAPFLFGDPEPSDLLDGDDEDGTNVELLRYGLVAATTARDNATSARERGDVAAAVVYTARTLADTLATRRTLDAVRSGDYGVPADTAAVTSERDAAADALREASSAPPSLLAALTLAPTVRRFQYADERLLEDPTDRTVARESARYTYVSYVADAVPAVVDRVSRELGAAGG